MTSTTAIVSHEPKELMKWEWSLEEVTLTAPGDDEILIEMYASGICHTDILLSSVPAGTLGVQYPKVVGHEGAGIARAVGKNVQSVSVGDPVLLSFSSCSACIQCQESHPAYCDTFAYRNYVGHDKSMSMDPEKKIWSQFFGQSSFAKHSIVNKSSVVNAKDLINDLDELKLFAPLGCGFQTGMGVIQNITMAMPNDTVLVTGLGAVGMGSVLTAGIVECKTIIAVDRVKSRLDLAKQLGATYTIDTSEVGFTTLDEAVRKFVSTGVSIAIDTTGVPTIIEQCVQATRARGKMVIVGSPPMGWELKVRAGQHLNSGRAIMGCVLGDCNAQIAIPQLIKWYREGKFPLEPFIRYFDATDYDIAVHKLESGEVIKPVLVWKH
ncbi:alcohol dehydrogenase [Penicillium pulvis]|uniref:alcohol dehydrogenase n=1 Tax=Penicillium pulvis TaxID=1562058 RepID=UPI002547F2F7|nr:alcohol dehydrogenase [Penicillium pulvis]KAJ5813759.1 alcohol dehydrogenase [Penicillium pulvis]